MRCLALDLASHVGWITFARPGEVAGRGTFVIPPARTLGQRFDLFFIWLDAKVAQFQPDILAFEEPIRGIPGRPAGIISTMPALKLLQGLAAIAELTAARCKVPRCIEVPIATAKKKLAGHGRAQKEQMIAAAVRKGINVADEHQADALAVALCAYEHCGVPVHGADGSLLDQLSRW